jgi:hypothetical protein
MVVGDYHEDKGCGVGGGDGDDGNDNDDDSSTVIKYFCVPLKLMISCDPSFTDSIAPMHHNDIRAVPDDMMNVQLQSHVKLHSV